MEKNRSRREFLSYLGILSLMLSMPIGIFSSKKQKNKKEYIFVNGWLLRKEDLNDI